jgi:hypothetical protein
MPPPTGEKIIALVPVPGSAPVGLAPRFLALTDAGAIYTLILDDVSGTATFAPLYRPSA